MNFLNKKKKRSLYKFIISGFVNITIGSNIYEIL